MYRVGDEGFVGAQPQVPQAPADAQPGHRHLTAEELLTQSLQAGQHIHFKEIRAETIQALTPLERAEVAAIQDAMGSEYAKQLQTATADKHEPSKRQKQRHQINSLYHQARLTELHDMERKQQGSKSKAETAAKYGW